MNVVANGARALSSAARSSSRSFFTRSILLSASSCALPPCSLPRMRSTSSSMPLAASTTSTHLIGIAGPAPGRIHHRPVEPPARREDAGRVDEHELAGAHDGDAAQRRARRLHLAVDDRDLGADQRIDQRRLAGVRRADHGDEAAACCRPLSQASAPRFHTPSRASSAVAAACSAARLLAPSPRAGLRPLMRTSAVKRGAWSGPWRSIST